MTAGGPSRGGGARRRRVLVVNAYFDHLRIAAPRRFGIPQTMAPAWLAGFFEPRTCDVRVWNEHHRGPLADPGLLGWPDLLVLTGLTVAFDRMLQVAALARTANPRVAVAAGGHAVRALPNRSRRYFDYVCTGDVEQIAGVIEDAFGPGHRAEEPFPRFDLADWTGRAGYVESSRNCNYRCTFCSLTPADRPWTPYPLEFLRRQIEALGRRRYLIFLDNNFYGNDRDHFLARMDLLREMKERGRLVGWAALVASDFLADGENLRLAREAGCGGLFCGIESFDPAVLRAFRKRHGGTLEQIEMVRRCLRAGIAFNYGVILDFTTRTLAEITEEIDFIVGSPDLPLPAYFTPVIPILGTPVFHDCVRRGLLLPNAKLRDFDTNTLAVRPRDPLPEVAAFVRDLPTLRRWRRRVPGRTLAWLRRHARHLSLDSLRISLGGSLLALAPGLAGGFRHRRGPRDRTFVTSTEPLDSYYTPAFPVDARYEGHFRPTMVTDARGDLVEALHEDLGPATRSAARVREGEGCLIAGR